jgi:putative oxidoreductase
MTLFRKLVSTTNDSTLTVLRLVLGVVFLAHGAQKMLGWFGGYGFSATMGFFTQQMGIPAALAFLAIAAEFFGGLGLVVGFLGRVAAFGILSNMVVAVLMVHLPYGFFMNWAGNQKGEGFEYHLLAIALGLAILVKGSGAFSVDRLLTGPRSSEAATGQQLKGRVIL